MLMFYANLDPTGYGTVTVLYGQKVIMMIAILNIDQSSRAFMATKKVRVL